MSLSKTVDDFVTTMRERIRLLLRPFGGQLATSITASRTRFGVRFDYQGRAIYYERYYSNEELAFVRPHLALTYARQFAIDAVDSTMREIEKLHTLATIAKTEPCGQAD